MNRAVASESRTSLEGVEPTARNGAPLRPDGGKDGKGKKGRAKAAAAATAASSAAAAASAAAATAANSAAAASAASAGHSPHGTSGAHGTPSPVAPAIDEQSRFTGIGTRGMTFERRWTTPGIHPYDEIEWELRTANIANESGKTVFEQTDVEVPKAWSQLATNVVVSKYFRGHIGTPQRERSVRQLIDRVVNTIAGWAETQHYFATDADLATFKAELTHLLVNQKMAFNSPGLVQRGRGGEAAVLGLLHQLRSG